MVQGSVNLDLVFSVTGNFSCSIVDQTGTPVGAPTLATVVAGNNTNLSVIGSSSTATGLGVLCNGPGQYSMTANVAAIQVGGIN
jgi:hypothetical protein